MSLFNSAAKVTLAIGCVVGGKLAYSSLSDQDKENLASNIKQFRRKLAEFIAPTEDGVIYNLARIPTEPEAPSAPVEDVDDED